MSAQWQGDCGDVVASLAGRLLITGFKVGKPYKTSAPEAAGFKTGLRDALAFAARCNGRSYQEVGGTFFGTADPSSYTARATGAQ